MKQQILVVGGGGHAKSVMDAITTTNEFEIVGIIDTKDKVGCYINGVEVIGEDCDLVTYFNKGIKNVVIAIGSIGNSEIRSELYQKCRNIGYKFPNIIDKSAILAGNIQLGEGNFIGKGVIVNTNVVIKSGCILNTGSIIEHDCELLDLVHIAPGALLCGGVRIGEGTHIGTRAVIIQNIQIGEHALIGAGSVVLKNIVSHTIAYGNPCREVEIREKGKDYSRSRC